MDLRGPYDVANLSLLFGMKKEDGLKSISENVKLSLLHGETRKYYKGAIKVDEFK